MFRADASEEIGGGHVMRCLTLADALAKKGWRCGFAVRNGTLDTIPALARSLHEVWVIDCAEPAEPQQLAARWPDGVDWLIVDHYGRDATFEGACRPWARRIMIIDDLADRVHDCDQLLDQTLGRTAAAYAGHVPDDCRLLLGPAYALLRPEFARARPAALARRQENGPVRRILVSMGATDPHNVLAVALEGIGRSGLDVEVDVVAGAASPHLAALHALAEDMPFPVTVHESVDDMADLMARADLAIGAAGSTSWERCCLGLPSLIVITADNQGKIAEELNRYGAAWALGWHEDVTSRKIAATTESIVADRKTRVDMSTRAAQLCDGRGTARCVAALDPERARDGGRVDLRPATMNDAGVMLQWQSTSDTRRYFRDPRAPEPEEHHTWLSNRLADPGCILNIILYGGRPAGVLRLDCEEVGSATPEVFQVSILVAPELYRRGVGKAALGLARRMLPRAELRGVVHPDNMASHALFRAAGYHRNGEEYVSVPA